LKQRLFITRLFIIKCEQIDQARSSDFTSHSRQRDKLREELTFAKIDHYSQAVDELDVEGILAFAERILTRAKSRRDRS
jgi:hypothetical protein